MSGGASSARKDANSAVMPWGWELMLCEVRAETSSSSKTSNKYIAL